MSFAFYTWKGASLLQLGGSYIRAAMALLLVVFLTFATLNCYTMITAAANKQFDEKELDTFLLIYGGLLALAIIGSLYVYYMLWSFAIQIENGEIALVTVGLRSNQLVHLNAPQAPQASAPAYPLVRQYDGDMTRHLVPNQPQALQPPSHKHQHLHTSHSPQPPVYDPVPTTGYNYQNENDQRYVPSSPMPFNAKQPQPRLVQWEPYTPPRTPTRHSPLMGPTNQ